MQIQLDLTAQHRCRHAEVLNKLLTQQANLNFSDKARIHRAIPSDVYTVCVQSFIGRLSLSYTSMFNEIFDRESMDSNRIELESSGDEVSFLQSVDAGIRATGFDPAEIIWTKAPLFIIIPDAPHVLRLSEAVIQSYGIQAALDAINLLAESGRIHTDTDFETVVNFFSEHLPAAAIAAQEFNAVSSVSLRVCAFIKEQMRLGDADITDDEREEALKFGRSFRTSLLNHFESHGWTMNPKSYFAAIAS